MPYTTPTPSTVSAGDTFPASAYNIISADLQDHESRIKAGVESYTTTQKNALTGVTTGTIIYDSTLGLLQLWDGSTWTKFVTSPPAAYVTRSTILTSYVGNTVIPFSSAVTDNDGMWSAGNPSVLTANTRGMYLVTANMYLTMTTVTNPTIIIKYGGADVANIAMSFTGGGYAWGAGSILLPMAATSQISVSVTWSALTGTAAIAPGGSTAPAFSAHMVAKW